MDAREANERRCYRGIGKLDELLPGPNAAW